jgi:hypothetical protein
MQNTRIFYSSLVAGGVGVGLQLTVLLYNRAVG